MSWLIKKMDMFGLKKNQTTIILKKRISFFCFWSGGVDCDTLLFFKNGFLSTCLSLIFFIGSHLVYPSCTDVLALNKLLFIDWKKEDRQNEKKFIHCSNSPSYILLQ